jgi:hypothetical protein
MTPLSISSPSLVVTDMGCVAVAEDVVPVLDVTVEMDDDVQEQEQEQEQEEYDTTYHDIFHTVLEDLIRVTHCHGCGKKRKVCFFGYAGQYCGKRCYYDYTLCDGEYDTHSEDYDAEDTERLPHSAIFCGWCDENTPPLSKANTDYHRTYRRGENPSGVYWPMGDPRRPCYNTCIRERPVVRIRGYNS